MGRQKQDKAQTQLNLSLWVWCFFSVLFTTINLYGASSQGDWLFHQESSSDATDQKHYQQIGGTGAVLWDVVYMFLKMPLVYTIIVMQLLIILVIKYSIE